MNKNEAYLIGYTKGDGSLYTSSHTFSLDPSKILKIYQIRWADKSIGQIKIIETILKSIFPDVRLSLKKRKDNCIILRCSRRKVFEYLSNLLKSDILNGATENISAFIRGFADAEGNVCNVQNGPVRNGKRYVMPRIQITQKNREILEEIRRVLATKFRIKSHIIKKYNQDAYMLTISGRKQVELYNRLIGFSNPEKNYRILSLLSPVQNSPKLDS